MEKQSLAEVNTDLVTAFTAQAKSAPDSKAASWFDMRRLIRHIKETQQI